MRERVGERDTGHGSALLARFGHGPGPTWWRARRRGGGARDLARCCAAERPSHAGGACDEEVVARATSLVPAPRRGLYTPARERERGSGREREWEREREGVGEAFTLATEGVRASWVVVGWRCSSRVTWWARWERRLGMRGKRTETQVLILYQYPLRASPWDNALRGGLLFLPAAVNHTIYRGGHFLFTEAGTFARHGKSMYRGGHPIKPASVKAEAQ